MTWRAGPLRKGANLCHGTAGNGYAFLALLDRTGDERWLTRARAFAMHAAAQVEHDRSEYGQGRYTLWTGDLGTALYLADCIDGGGKLPLPRRSPSRVLMIGAESVPEAPLEQTEHGLAAAGGRVVRAERPRGSLAPQRGAASESAL